MYNTISPPPPPPKFTSGNHGMPRPEKEAVECQEHENTELEALPKDPWSRVRVKEFRSRAEDVGFCGFRG